MSERDAQITIIIGRNGTGKSTFCEQIIKTIKGRAIVCTYNGMPKIWRPYKEVDIKDKRKMAFKRGIRQVIAGRYEISRNQNDTFKYLYRNFRNGFVVFDDARGYIGSNVDNDRYFRQLLLDFRHRMLDLVFVVHTPSDVPPRVWGFTSTVFVGATDSLVNKSQIKTDSADRVIEAQREINELYRQAKAKGDNSHYGLFKMVQL
jgi:nucleoside-triphosphatase THEP1